MIPGGSLKSAAPNTWNTGLPSCRDTQTSSWHHIVNRTRSSSNGVTRDLLVHDCVPAYKLWEVRLPSETMRRLLPFPGTQITYSRSQREVSPSVDSEEDAINRITALFVAMEYLGVIACSLLNYSEGTPIGGALSYLEEPDKRDPQASSTYSRRTRASGAKSMNFNRTSDSGVLLMQPL